MIACCGAACTPASTSKAEAKAAQVEAPGDPVQEAAEPEPVKLVIGWGAVPAPATAEQSRMNKAALKKHKAGDFEGALTGFEAAEELNRDYVWPRFNGACALSRLGRTAESTGLMRPLLLADFPRFRRRFLHDPDLENTRASAAGKKLLEQFSAISDAYIDALTRGTPAFIYAERTGELVNENGHYEYQTPYTDLRIGVYDHSAKRFVPMVPKVSRTYSGVLNRDKKRAIVAVGQLKRKDMWEVQPHRASARLYSLENFGELLLEAKHASPPRDVFHGFELWVGPDDTIYGAQYMVGYAPQTDYFHWTSKGRKKIGWTHDDTNRNTPPRQVPRSDPSVMAYELAEAHYRIPTKATFKTTRKATTVGYDGIKGMVTLEKGHHELADIYASPDPMIFVVASNAVAWGGAGEFPTPTDRDRYVIDLVDMHDKIATRLAKARGYCHVAWSPDGTLFLDAPTGVTRYAPGSTEPQNDVMPGIRFGTPPFPEEGGA